MQSPRERVRKAIDALNRGEFVVVADDAQRENEGDLIARADRMTPEALAFLIRHTSGLICVAMTPERLDALGLPLMVGESTEAQGTAFTVSVDYKYGTSTGISAADRSNTIRALADPAASRDHFNRPGHVFPLRARPGGVLERRGHTEAAVDLARLAGGPPVGVLCEIMNDDGTMARGPELLAFAQEHGLAFLRVEDIVAFRIPLFTEPTAENVQYLRAEEAILGHALGLSPLFITHHPHGNPRQEREPS